MTISIKEAAKRNPSAKEADSSEIKKTAVKIRAQNNFIIGSLSSSLLVVLVFLVIVLVFKYL